jgi:arabinose operon protein AraL
VLQEIEAVIIDLDGTMFKGKRLIPKADDAVAYLRSLGKRIAFVSNRGNISQRMCYEWLKKWRISVRKEEIILSSTVTAEFLYVHYPFCKVWTLGDDGLQEELQRYHVRLTKNRKKRIFWL